MFYLLSVAIVLTNTSLHSLMHTWCQYTPTSPPQVASVMRRWTTRTTRSAISSESILGSMGMNGVDEKPFACPVPGYNKRYKADHYLSLLIISSIQSLSSSRALSPFQSPHHRLTAKWRHK